MKDLIKAFEGHDIRFVVPSDKPYAFGIVAIDFAKVLGSNLDGHRFARLVDDKYKTLHDVELPEQGYSNEVLVIWEPGIYQLLARSRSKNAEPFQDWLFVEALPAIRATGSYSITPQSSQLSLSPADLEAVAQLVVKQLESTTLDFQPTKKAIDASLAQAVAQLKDHFLELVGGIGHKITVDLSATQKHRMDVIDFLRQLVENQSTILGNQKFIYDLLQNQFNPPSAFELEYKGVDWEAAFKRHKEKQKKEWEEFVLANGGWAPPIE